ncbi:MAG: energy transducer TonB [Flavobacteriaceae bacterium]|nr:energy transducer TonB [Flavobacteriaceae bacterium]
MSRLSIYETNWIDLVFENRNKEYGAYQLRRDSSRTTVMAFFSGILLIAAFGAIFALSNVFEKPIVVETNPIIDEPIIVTPYSVQPIKPKTPVNTSQAKVPQEPKVLQPMVVSSTPDVVADVPTNRDAIESHLSSSGTEGGTGINNTTGTIESPTLPIDDGKGINSTTELDKLPEFPGGINKFYTYVGNNFEKPDIDASSSLKIYVAFVIEKDGSMTDIKVLKDPGYGLGREAIRVLKSLKTKWSPGMIGSKPVRTSYNLPITVQLN